MVRLKMARSLLLFCCLIKLYAIEFAEASTAARWKDRWKKPSMAPTAAVDKYQLDELGTVAETLPELITQEEKKDYTDLLSSLLEPWKQKIKKENRYRKNMVYQKDLFSSACQGSYNFINYEFDDQHQLTANSKRLLKKTLTVCIDELKPAQQLLEEKITPLFIRAAHALAKKEKLIGKKKIRTILRLFISNSKKNSRQKVLKNQLEWHWDYCAKSTVTLELYNDFAPSGIFVAKNSLSAPQPDPTKRASHKNSIPQTSTIQTLYYPPCGALYFKAKQGAVIHAPLPITQPEAQEKVLMRAVLQVVLFDDNWPIPLHPT